MSSKTPQFTVVSWFSLSSWKLRMGEIRRDPEATKILMMRLALVIFLICAAAAVSVNTFKKLTDNQQSSFESSFHSVSQSALNSVVDSFDRISLGIQQLSATYAELFPEPEQWPNVGWNGFASVVDPLCKISAVQGMAIFPLVYPSGAANFTKYTYDYYTARPAEKDIFFPYFFPNGSIWVQNETTLEVNPYEVTSGITPPRKLFTPMLQYTVSPMAGKYFVGYDIHSSTTFSGAVESVLSCAHTHNYSVAVKSCGAISEVASVPYAMVEDPDPVVNDMVALFAHPIFPSSNHSAPVGIAGGTLSWAALLHNVVPSFVHNVDCVVKAHNRWFTFTIGHGPPRFKGLGDLHDRKFSKYAVCSGSLNPSLGLSNDATSHRLTLYPTQEFHDTYFSIAPLQSALVMISIFVLCSFLFYAYDILMKREFSRRQAVLDTKRRFVRFISHEIRTPLNTVRLGLKLFDEELIALLAKINRYPSSELSSIIKNALVSWKGLTDEILESSDSAVEVLDDLLNYDKIEIGTLRLEFGLFDMRELAVKCTSMMQVHAKQKGISLVLQCEMDNTSSNVTPYSSASSEPSPRLQPSYLASIEEARGSESAVVGDATRLSQVLRNLISNALKFTPSKGVITISVDTVPTFVSISEKVRLSSPLFQNVLPAGTIRVAVTDSGAGLTEQQLAQICKEGMQFNANELQAGQGSGLGLFISKGIVEQHGGRLSVASEGLGKGVTFTVELPLFKDEAGVRSARSSIRHISKCPSSVSSVHHSAEGSRVSSSKGEGLPLLEETRKRILVVDDSPFNRKMLVRLLTSKGYECAQAEDGADALRVYQELTFGGECIDAVMMDFEMPVMNGPTATKKLRELGCTCLIIGVTGNVLPDQVASFKSHGADAVLPKPLVMEDLQFLLSDGTHEDSPAAMRLTTKLEARTDYSNSTSQVYPEL